LQSIISKNLVKDVPSGITVPFERFPTLTPATVIALSVVLSPSIGPRFSNCSATKFSVAYPSRDGILLFTSSIV
jgi:hypothetical protein